MNSKITEQQFLVMYDHFLDGKNLYEIADQNWERYGYASSESFRIAFRSRCIRRNLPLRDVPASRRKPPTVTVNHHVTMTPEIRRFLKDEVSKARRRIQLADRKSRIWL